MQVHALILLTYKELSIHSKTVIGLYLNKFDAKASMLKAFDEREYDELPYEDAAHKYQPLNGHLLQEKMYIEKVNLIPPGESEDSISDCAF